jgi:membrane associated rhomboid family serine protease
MHATIGHLLSNMWFLWIFGGAVEHRSGPVGLALVYFFCGTMSMVVQTAHSPLSNVPIVGASGAIAGLMGFHLVSRPLSRVLVWVPPLFFLRIPSCLFLGIWLSIQYVGLQGGSPANAHIAWWAHIGGFACGLLSGVVHRQKAKGRAGPSRRQR